MKITDEIISWSLLLLDYFQIFYIPVVINQYTTTYTKLQSCGQLQPPRAMLADHNDSSKPRISGLWYYIYVVAIDRSPKACCSCTSIVLLSWSLKQGPNYWESHDEGMHSRLISGHDLTKPILVSLSRRTRQGIPYNSIRMMPPWSYPIHL